MDEALFKKAIEREKTARKKAEKLLEDKSRELFFLNQNIEKKNDALTLQSALVAFAQNQEIDSSDILAAFLKTVSQFSNWLAGHIFFYEPSLEYPFISSDIWHVKDTARFQAFIDETKDLHFKPGQGFPSRVFNHGGPLWVDDIFNQPNSKRANSGKMLNITGAFGLPLYRYGKIFAIAEFFSETDAAQDDSLLEITESASQQISTILERRLKEKELAKKNTELEQTLIDLKNTQSQLNQSAKLASIGQLAAGVAHEINNPIGFVSNNISVMNKYATKIKQGLETYQQLESKAGNLQVGELSPLLEELATFRKKNKVDFILEDMDDLIKESLEGIERVAGIVQNLKLFSRVDQAETEPSDINALIESTINLTANDLKYKCTIEQDFSELPLLDCNPGKLNQVFMNMIINAGQAIEDKGTIHIKTRMEQDHILISFQDDGSGIEEENLDKLFDPFFTTKPVGEGTGLGLSISYGIVEEHGGTITVDSTLGVGTRFDIQLPINTCAEQTQAS